MDELVGGMDLDEYARRKQKEQDGDEEMNGE
jgi:hypothetical protein